MPVRVRQRRFGRSGCDRTQGAFLDARLVQYAVDLSRAPRFFETLAFMHGAEAPWRFCEPHRPTILTGLPLGA